MSPKDGRYIMLVSVHGLIRGFDMELGRDADTGGQVKYVVELARSLIEHCDVEKVDLVTRLVSDPRIDDSYAEPIEELAPEVNIVRVECGPRRYLRKESLWPYLDVFVDNVVRYLRSIGRAPDLVHGHYADAGCVASCLAGLLDIPMAFTGHSLGRVKNERLLDQGKTQELIEKRYRITRRIEAEETSLETASFVVASTSQEVEQQYAGYDNYQPSRMIVIPPGMDLNRFRPPQRSSSDYRRIASQASRFLAHPRKPMILALSRPDARKNIVTLLRAYGENERLREMANLGLVMGVRDDIRAAAKGPREVLTEVLMLIDYYDLYGSVAYPKQHDPDDVPLFYQLAARTRGVFVNPALSEPFGLTLIEAAASGLPVVATEDGGPRDILKCCKNGLLIDPLDAKGMGDALLDALSDRERWKRWSKSGIAGARRHFSWSAHVNKYMRFARSTVTQHEKRRVGVGSRRRLISADRILLCDIDNTLIGDRAGLAELLRRLDEASSDIVFGVATGRSLELTRQVLKEWKLPTPQLLITSVGTDLHYGPHLIEDRGWEMVIRHRWLPDEIRRVTADIPGVRLQPPEGQSEYKISYLVDPEEAPGLRDIVRTLRQAGLQATVVYSHQAYLDLLPIRASKGKALRYFALKWDIPIERCLVAGDSGNDEEMLTGNTLGVVVGNHDKDLEKLKGHPRVYFAKGHHAWGILEGIEHYDFFGSIHISEQEPLIDDRGAHQLSRCAS